MGDSLLIHDLVLHAFHGVHEAESRHGQRFVMDLIVEADFRAAAAEDAYEKAICYDRLINDVSALFTQRRFQLIEAAAEAVAALVLERNPQATKVIVELRKPHAPVAAHFSSVGVRLERQRML
jgi:7,8-dihydroneopterin aldolase/epimerase/oxygenase